MRDRTVRLEKPEDLDLKANSASMAYGGGDECFTFGIYEGKLDVDANDVGYYGDSASVTLDLKSLKHLQKLVEYAIATYPEEAE